MIEVIDQVARDQIAAILDSSGEGGETPASLPVVVAVISTGEFQYVLEHNLNDQNIFWQATANWPVGIYEVSRDNNSVTIGFSAETPLLEGGVDTVLRVRLVRSSDGPIIVADITEDAFEYVLQHNLNNLDIFWEAMTNWPAGLYEISRDSNAVTIGFEGQAPPSAQLRARAYL